MGLISKGLSLSQTNIFATLFSTRKVHHLIKSSNVKVTSRHEVNYIEHAKEGFD